MPIALVDLGLVHLLRRALRGVWNALWVVIFLAVLATVPILQVAVLGYLMEVAARVARQGRFSAGCIGWDLFGRWGTWALGTAAVLAPLGAISYWRYLAYLVNAEGPEPASLDPGFALTVCAVFFHLVTAWYAGGKWRHFLWPAWFPLVILWLIFSSRPAQQWFPPAIWWKAVRERRFIREVTEIIWRRLCELRFFYYFRLGLQGLIGTIAWLFVPVFLMALAFEQGKPVAGLLGAVGAIGYGWVIIYMPFLQTAFAVTDRWKDMFRVATVRRAYRHAPVAMLTAWLVTFGLTLPLYLLKIEYTPRELAWLPAVIFVVLGLPGRWLTGWAWGRAMRREAPSPLWIRWFTGAVLLVAAGFYSFLVFLTQYVSWHGTWSLLEQPALLLPVPFWG